MSHVDQTELRKRLSRVLSELYGDEVPAYNMLVEVAQEVNQAYQRQHPEQAELFGSLERVTAERHGAIRVGSPKELAQAARIFGAVGMYSVNFYDLRDAKPKPIPVVSTAFRPIDRTELAANPFRVFTSMLVPEDRRFFTVELEKRLKEYISQRVLFPEELLNLADSAIAGNGLPEEQAQRFLDLAAAAFALSSEPVDRAWYEELESISSVAADIGGVSSTHINHLTPRVLDIDELYSRMESRGIKMIDAIQGPPKWEGPDVLLRQTSFKALSEPRLFKEADGSVSEGALQVRFGEVEARGIALTLNGREVYDAGMAEVEAESIQSGRERSEVMKEVWARRFPRTEIEFLKADLGYFTFELATDAPVSEKPTRLIDLVTSGHVRVEPIVYEDFLPQSAAGIFASNLSSDGNVRDAQGEAPRDATWMSERLGTAVLDSFEIYAQERASSLTRVCQQLGMQPTDLEVPWDRA